MLFLSNPECVAWCAERSFPTIRYPGYSAPLPSPRPADFGSVRFFPPKDSGQKAALAKLLWSLLPQDTDVLVWVGAWDVWPSSGHMPLFDRVRQGLGESRPIYESPGHLVGARETDDGITLLVLSLQFIWDCHAIAGNGQAVAFLSHDEYGWFGTHDASVLPSAREILTPYANAGTA